jgi:NAD(P)-dependent dehydrogenase (short-subunit alcohol dehydrogenase family)
MSVKTVFVTGAAGGLGAATSRYLAEKGWRVFAGDFDASALREIERVPGITGVPLDVTDAESVEAARATVAASVDGLDAVVNFAGILGVGSLVELDTDEVARVLDVNVLGTVRVNRQLFPLIAARKGRIVNISSETGWQSGMPFNGPYAMSKHAIEAYSDSLRRELVFLGVAVIKIQPGPFRTAMVAGIERNFTRAMDASTHFKPLLAKVMSLAVNEQNKAHDPTLLARIVYRALTERRPRAAYSVKPDPARTVLHLLPTRVADTILARVMRG